MNILVLSFYFPPYNCIGAVRVGKTVKALRAMGHEVKVVSARNQPLPDNLEVEIPESDVMRTAWVNVNAPVEILLGGRKRVAAKGFASAGGSGGGSWLGKLGAWYKQLLHFPDAQIGWLPFACRAARKIARNWRPDVIFASATPYTTLMAAQRLSRRLAVPWVGELRDLWMDNPYIDRPGWRKSLEATLERNVLADASGLVTVSEPLAEILRGKAAVPVRVVTNAFDPEDYPEAGDLTADDRLHIVYTGMIYAGRRDPSPLFKAIARLGDLAGKVRVTFVGRYLDTARELASQHGVAASVRIMDPVSHHEALRIQSNADVLLLLLWDDPSERGTFTGKVFEYMGAGRPVLAIGPKDNVAAQLIVDRGLGLASGDPVRVEEQLRSWLAFKSAGKAIPALSAGQRAGFSRQDQVRVLEGLLNEAAASPRAC